MPAYGLDLRNVLDLEILERAFDLTCEAIKASCQPINFDSDEGLEALLRRELIEIACLNGISDPETLRDGEEMAYEAARKPRLPQAHRSSA